MEADDGSPGEVHRMKSREQLIKEWSRSLVATVLAVIIISAIVGAAIQGMSTRDRGNRLPVQSKAGSISKSHGGQADTSTGRSHHLATTTRPNATTSLASQAGETTKALRNTAVLHENEPNRSGAGAKTTIESRRNTESSRLAVGAGSEPRPPDDSIDGVSKPSLGNPGATPDGQAPRREPKLTVAERQKSDARWRKVIGDLHKRFHARGPETTKAKARDKAEADLSAIDDPAAVPAFWATLAGNHAHHQLLGRLLSRFATPDATKMLAALAVYSQDEKARIAAKNSLVTREANDFIEPLISVFNEPMRFRPEWIDIPGQGRAQVLLIEGARVDYQFLYPTPDNPPPPGPAGVYSIDQPYMSREERQMAEAYNKAQAVTARRATEQQLKADIEEVKRLNQLVEVMNDRSATVLRAATGQYFGSDREAWRRWLAQRRGYPYLPPKQVPKPTIAQVVPPLYNPTFISVPAAT
jgi:hypothetical protein